jgi:hypothetical protein
MVVHICNPSTQEAEAGELDFKVSLGYIVRHVSERKPKKQPKKSGD